MGRKQNTSHHRKRKGLSTTLSPSHILTPEYWRRVVDDPSIPVDIDEGAEKSGCGMTLRIPITGITGRDNVADKG